MLRPIPVLLYHAVQDDPPPNERRWAVTPSALQEHLDVLAGAGAVGLSVGELSRHLDTGEPVPPGSVVVTFDDGLADQLPAAATCAAAGFPVTVYVTAGFLGRTGYLDAPAISELAMIERVDIGGHSVGHPHLDLISLDNMQREIDGCRERLRDVIQRDVLDFAFPHGSHGRRERDYLAATGWTSGAAVKNALTHRADNRFGFARVTITHRTTRESLVQMARGEGAPVAWSEELLRTRAFRHLRRMRHCIGSRGEEVER